MQAVAPRVQHQAKPMSRGVHHLALNTDDMKMTIDFYVDVLGMPLVHAFKVPPGLGTGPANRGNPPFENVRHYFFDAGGDTLVAFFEMPKGAKPQADRDAIAGMQHCSFTTTEDNFHALVKRLEAAQVPLVGPMFVGNDSWSVYFMDPNGIRLEFTYQIGDGEDVRVLGRWTQTQEEIMDELGSLCADKAWLAQRTRHLPEKR